MRQGFLIYIIIQIRNLPRRFYSAARLISNKLRRRFCRGQEYLAMNPVRERRMKNEDERMRGTDPAIG